MGALRDPVDLGEEEEGEEEEDMEKEEEDMEEEEEDLEEARTMRVQDGHKRSAFACFTFPFTENIAVIKLPDCLLVAKGLSSELVSWQMPAGVCCTICQVPQDLAGTI